MSSFRTVLRGATMAAPVLVPVPTRANGHNGTATAVMVGTESAHLVSPPGYDEAEAIIARAAAEADSLRQAAWEQGLAEGRAAGRAAIELDLAEQIATVRALAAGIAGERERILGSCERDLVALALAIAGRVVRDQAAVDPRVVQGVVQAALGRLGAEDKVRVRLNPLDLAAVESLYGSLPPVDGGREVELAGDEAIQRGGCLVEVSGGTVDARVDAQLAETVRYFESIVAGV